MGNLELSQDFFSWGLTSLLVTFSIQLPEVPSFVLMRAIVSYVNYHFYSLAFLFADKLYLEHNVFWINVIYVFCCFCAFLNVRIKRVSVNQSVDF